MIFIEKLGEKVTVDRNYDAVSQSRLVTHEWIETGSKTIDLLSARAS